MKTTRDHEDRQCTERGGYRFAQRITGVAPGTLYRWVHDKTIPHIRLGPRTVIFEREALEAWLADRRVAAGS